MPLLRGVKHAGPGERPVSPSAEDTGNSPRALGAGRDLKPRKRLKIQCGPNLAAMGIPGKLLEIARVLGAVPGNL